MNPSDERPDCVPAGLELGMDHRRIDNTYEIATHEARLPFLDATGDNNQRNLPILM